MNTNPSNNDWSDDTDDTWWCFCDELNVSRLETFGLDEAARFRLAVLERNARAFGFAAEEIVALESGAGAVLTLWGRGWMQRIAVTPERITLSIADLDEKESWADQFDGQAAEAASWFVMLQKLAGIENVGLAGSGEMFETPR